ncbi:glycosyltransferase family 4 protein [Croceicoccus gelatinilyticus]|uniref:glycosyltransferase family 4 protein n=1 Tax=Croceicoccus gelatinilyticus TaxID=2835536 RepID=UPI001BCEB5C7|nr:glycosyltransferase family 4 protein [Croceicoccus gelatinilyticus]
MNTLYPPTTVGGAERSVAVLAEALAAAGDDVHVIALDDCAQQSTQVVNGVTVHRLPHANIYWPFEDDARPSLAERAGWHLKDRGSAPVTDHVATLLRELRPDVLHTNNLSGFGSAIIPLARDLKIPVVHTLRDFSLLCARSSLFRSGKDCTGRCLSCRMLTGPRMQAAEGAQIVVGNSRYMVDRHRAEGLFARTAARTIYNAVPDIAGGKLTPERKESTPLRIGFMGAIKAEKGIEQLLGACRALPVSDWRLVIAGKGDENYVKGLKASHADLPIDWLGFVAAERFYAESDLVVIPSIWPEPMPRTLIETMVNGLPVLVADAGGAPEVAQAYPNATIYPRRDTGALAKLLTDAISQRPPRVQPDREIRAAFGAKRLAAEYREAYHAAITQVANG